MVFLDDDYHAINSEYFEEIRSRGGFLDPSGWLDTASDALALLPQHQLDTTGLQSYYGDLSTNLGASKEKILGLLGKWDECSYVMEEVTICQSATAASFLVLAFLKSKGIRTVLFESPCYYASLEQCDSLGLFAKRIATNEANSFELEITKDYMDGASPCALWLTQPRIGLGFNQDAAHVHNLLKLLPADGFLILDEAVEQCFPSILRTLIPSQLNRVMKIRSMFKPCGLNGIRISFVLHHSRYRMDFAHILERYNPTLDFFSLSYATKIAEDPAAFKTMLDSAKSQTNRLRVRAEAISDGSYVQVTKLVTGYIGSLAIDFGTNSIDKYLEVRRELLIQCKRNRLPIILGASMYFAINLKREYVRLNFFNREHHILEGIEMLMDISKIIHRGQ